MYFPQGFIKSSATLQHTVSTGEKERDIKCQKRGIVTHQNETTPTLLLTLIRGCEEHHHQRGG